MSFLIVFLVFILAFGISIEAIMNRNPATLKNLLNVVYWPIYGEIRILDQLDSCLENADSCLNLKESYVIMGLLMVYMAIASVVLLNLVIAMFR